MNTMKWIWTWLVLVGACVLGADVVTLAWDRSPSGGVAHYRVRYGTNESFLDWVTNCGPATTAAVVVPFYGRWYFRVAAVSTNGMESPMSNLVEWEALPEPPQMKGESWVRLVPVIERSTNGANWQSVAGVPTWFPATNAQEFFTTRRLLIERVERVAGQ